MLTAQLLLKNLKTAVFVHLEQKKSPMPKRHQGTTFYPQSEVNQYMFTIAS